MPNDISFSFDASDPEDRRWITRLTAYKLGKATGVPVDLVRRVNQAKIGRTFVRPLATAMTPGQHYNAQQLATILGTGWTPKKVASKFNVMGRPEKRHGKRIFERPSPGQYAITEAMKNSILDAANQ